MPATFFIFPAIFPAIPRLNKQASNLPLQGIRCLAPLIRFPFFHNTGDRLVAPAFFSGEHKVRPYGFSSMTRNAHVF